MPRLRLGLAYDGAAFAGSQVQPGQRTVQGTLEAALATLNGTAARATFAGRTDTGVHAIGQVAHADVSRAEWSGEKWRQALNALLPPEVRVLAVREVVDGWHARYDARWREYRYTVWNGPVLPPLARGTHWLVRGILDLAKMQRATRYLVGEYDFAAFAGDGKGIPGTAEAERTTRIVRQANWTAAKSPEPVAGISLTFSVEANGFLTHMVRNMVGALVAVGRGTHEPEQLATLIAARDRRLAPPTAPPQGLTLWRVRYDDDDNDSSDDDTEGGNDDADNDEHHIFAKGSGSHA